MELKLNGSFFASSCEEEVKITASFYFLLDWWYISMSVTRGFVILVHNACCTQGFSKSPNKSLGKITQIY